MIKTKFLGLAVLGLVLYASSSHAITQIIGDIDSFGWDGSVAGLTGSDGGPADKDGNGTLGPLDLLPDINTNTPLLQPDKGTITIIGLSPKPRIQKELNGLMLLYQPVFQDAPGLQTPRFSGLRLVCQTPSTLISAKTITSASFTATLMLFPCTLKLMGKLLRFRAIQVIPALQKTEPYGEHSL